MPRPSTPIVPVLVAAFLGLAAADPDRAAWTVVEEARVRAGLAQALMEERRWDESIEHLNEVVRITPTWSFARTLLARARRARGLDHAPTLATLRVALQYSPASVAALRERAGVLEELGRQRQALAGWRALAAVAPRDVQANVRIGALALDVGDLPTARSYLRRAAALDRRDRVSLARLAEALELSHDLGAAEDLLRTLAEASPKDPWRWKALLDFLVRHDRPGGLAQARKRWVTARKARTMKRRRMRPLRSPRRR